MRVLYFGTYERHYPRNAQVISALRHAGVDVVEAHEPVWEGQEHKAGAGAAAAYRLARAELRLFRKSHGAVDAVIVGYPGHADLLAARRIARGAPVVFNPLVSLWDTLVDDRERFGATSLAAKALRQIDRRALRAADVVVADTEADAEFFAALAGLPRDRFEVAFVGAEDRLFSGPWAPSGPVVFVGKLIPLHGIDIVLAAARLIPDTPIRVVGSGQLTRLLADRPDNVQWTEWLPYDELPALLRASAGALGIFGTSSKARRVVPNKVFQALACGTPVITADTPAAHELLTDGRDALLVEPGSPEALAEAITRLQTDRGLAERLGSAGLATYQAHASEEVLGACWRELLERAISRKRGGAAQAVASPSRT